MNTDEKRGRGRPPKKPEDNPKNKRINLRLTQEEYTDIKELAKDCGMNVTDLIIEALKFFREQKKAN